VPKSSIATRTPGRGQRVKRLHSSLATLDEDRLGDLDFEATGLHLGQVIR